MSKAFMFNVSPLDFFFFFSVICSGRYKSNLISSKYFQNVELVQLLPSLSIMIPSYGDDDMV